MLTIGQIVDAVDGSLRQGNTDLKIKSVVIDSRHVKKGSIFVAIKGVNHDGHAFIKKAVKNGAVAVVVSKRVRIDGLAVVQVKDTTKALGQIAKCYRQRFKIPIIAITGSAGKTTIKNLIAAVLASKYKVLKNKGSENNWIGVPLTLLKLRAEHDIAVVELGTNQFGDIAWLTEIVQPEIAVLTNIGDSHLQGLGNKRGVFKEKSQLVKGLQENGVIIFNKDDPFLRKFAEQKQSCKTICYSIEQKSGHQAKIVGNSNLKESRFNVGSSSYRISVPGRHHIYNALAAICCAEYFGISHRKIHKALFKFKPEFNRGKIKRLGKYWVYDDSYNSNPLSFKLALEVLRDIPTKGRKVLVCADMLELGRESVRLHRSMAKFIHQAGLDLVLAYGPHSKWIINEFKKFGDDSEAYHCRTHSEIHRRLKRYCQSGDFILVKGSRSMNMEKTIHYIQNRLTA